MDTIYPGKNMMPETSSSEKKKIQNLSALVILLVGLFVGSLLVDFVQLALQSGFSRSVIKEYDLLQVSGKTWVAYYEPKVSVQVLSDRTCDVCDPSEALLWLRRVIPTLEATKVDISSAQGERLRDQFHLTSMPALVFSKNVTDTNFYIQASSLFTENEGKYFFDMGKIGLPVGKYLQTPEIEDDDIVIGERNAQVKIVEFSDSQCAYCKTFQSDLNKVLKEYAGKVVFVFKHLPLSSHLQSENAALSASCAYAQGKFPIYSEHLFAKQDEWGKTTGTQKFTEYAWRFGLNGRVFAECLNTKKYAEKVALDKSEALHFSLSGTPATFINDVFIEGAVSREDLRKIIEQELAK